MKKILLYTFLIFTLSSCLWDKKEEKKEIIGDIISSEKYTTEITPVTQKDDKKTNEELKIIDKLGAFSRALCNTAKNAEDIASSRYLKKMKDIIKELKKESGKDELDILYVTIPQVVLLNCSEKDENFKEKFILYLQSSDDNFVFNNDFEEAKLKTFIKNINFNSMEGLDKNKLKKDKSYFEEFFLNKNRETLNSFYFPYYAMNNSNPINFLNKPIFTLEEDNEYKKLALERLNQKLKDIGFKDISELRTTILKLNGYNDVSAIKNLLLNDINKLDDVTKKQLFNISDFKKLILSGGYKQINNNLVDNFGKNMLLFSIINDDYADGINEEWSGEEFFQDKEKGNMIIKLGFISLLK